MRSQILCSASDCQPVAAETFLGVCCETTWLTSRAPAKKQAIGHRVLLELAQVSDCPGVAPSMDSSGRGGGGGWGERLLEVEQPATRAARAALQ